MAVSTKALMWILTIILFIGIIFTYIALNEQYTSDNKYTGLILICIGFFGSVFVATNTKTNDNYKEGFRNKLKNIQSLYI